MASNIIHLLKPILCQAVRQVILFYLNRVILMLLNFNLFTYSP